MMSFPQNMTYNFMNISAEVACINTSNATFARRCGLNRKISNSGRVVEIRPADVLCGRGKVSFNHSGNRKFRHIISCSMDEYNAATSKFQKSMVAGRIVSMIRNEGGRFLKQKKNNENEWYELSPSEAKSKCSHAIRDAIAISKQRKPSVSSPSIPSSSDSKTEVKEEPEPLVNRGGPVRTWSSNTLVTLTDDGDTSSSEGKDSDDVPIKSLSVSLPEEAPSICAHISDDSWRSSDDEDSSSSDCDDEFEDDFLAYIEKVMGPGPDVRKTVI